MGGVVVVVVVLEKPGESVKLWKSLKRSNGERNPQYNNNNNKNVNIIVCR